MKHVLFDLTHHSRLWFIGATGAPAFKMILMNPKFVLMLLCASLCAAAPAYAKNVLPDACGDDAVTFDVSLKKDAPPPAGPADGKAQIVLIGTYPYEGRMGMPPTVRFGVDGTWVGANKADSYFILDVDPGKHNLCVAIQKVQRTMAKNFVDMASFTAEAGKVYYFEAKFGEIGAGGGGILTFGLAPLGEDEGKYRVKAWKLATWKSK